MTDGSVCRVSASTPLRQFSTIAGLNPHKPLSKKNPCTPANAKAKQIISDTLLISHLLQGDSVIIPTFTYNQEQGYSIAIEPSNSLVHIGFPPFQKKIGRLHQILKKNKNKSLQIDLDFENKAFIKEVDTPI